MTPLNYKTMKSKLKYIWSIITNGFHQKMFESLNRLVTTNR